MALSAFSRAEPIWQEEGDSDSDSLEPSPHDEHLWWQILDPHFPPGIQGVKISGVLKRIQVEKMKKHVPFVFFWGGRVMFKSLVIEGNIDNLRFFFWMQNLMHSPWYRYYYVYTIRGFTSSQPLKRWGSTPLSTPASNKFWVLEGPSTWVSGLDGFSIKN